MAEESIRRETAKHISDTFNSAPDHSEHDDDMAGMRELEAAHTKEVMLHAVTKFELQECREAIKAAIFLAECGEVPAPVTVQRWGKLL